MNGLLCTSQIRRSSRSICLNLREAWAKRRYEAHFISKLTDCDGENSETDSSLDFAKDCGYITSEQHTEMTSLCQEIGKMLGSMINNPSPFLTSDLRPLVSAYQRFSLSAFRNGPIVFWPPFKAQCWMLDARCSGPRVPKSLRPSSLNARESFEKTEACLLKGGTMCGRDAPDAHRRHELKFATL
jgi:four helix bundle protein